MILENVCIDWRCTGCGTVRRVDVDDPTKTVAGYRPPGWVMDRTSPTTLSAVCDKCASTTSPSYAATAQVHRGAALGEAADEMRSRLSSLHSGRSSEAPGGAGIRQPVMTTATVRGEGGAQTQVPLRGEGGVPVTVTGGQAAPAPARTLPGMDGHSSATVGTPQGGSSIVFEDTRTTEFLGPEKTVAGVPSLMGICIGCKQKIQDGVDSGFAEAWRFASGSSVERGHPACLDKIGR